MLGYLTSEEEPRWTRWLLLLFIPLLWLYFVAAKGNAETKNHDVWKKDQKVYLNTASKIAHDPGGYFTPRQRTPGYPYFLSMFYSKEKFDVPDGTKPPFAMEWFERAKMINIVLSMFLLAGLYFFCRRWLPLVESGIVVVTSGLLLFTYKAGMVQPELSYWVLNTVLFVLLGRMLIKPGWWLAAFCGLLSVVTYFVKAGTQPLLFLFVVTWGIKLLWDFFSYRRRTVRGLLDEGESNPKTGIALGQGALVLVLFVVLLVPYFIGTNKRFGKPLYSVYTEYMMWLPLKEDGSYMVNKDYMWAFYNAGARERRIDVDEFNVALSEYVTKQVTKESGDKLGPEELEAAIAKRYQPLEELPSASTYFADHPPVEGVSRVTEGFSRTNKRMKKYYRRGISMLKFVGMMVVIALFFRVTLAILSRYFPDIRTVVGEVPESRSLKRLFARRPYLIFYGVGFFTGYLALYAWYDALQIDERLMLSLYVPLLLVLMIMFRFLLGGVAIRFPGRPIHLDRVVNIATVVFLMYLSMRLLGGLELYDLKDMR